jgi:glutaredoxin
MGGSLSTRSKSKGDKMAAEAKVTALIEKHKVVVFSKTYCPHCVKAKKALQQFITDFTVVEVRAANSRESVESELNNAYVEYSGRPGTRFCVCVIQCCRAP